MELLLEILFLLTITVGIWLRKKLNYWKRLNVETTSLRDLYGKNKQHFSFVMEKIYKKMKKENKLYVGVYNILTPALIIIDLELIKSILITNFEAFPDRGFYSNPHRDPLSVNLVRLGGEKWKKMRQKLTPSFTSGKIKMMFPTTAAIGERLVQVINDQLDSNRPVIEIRDLCARFTTDVIGSIAFGLDCNSLKHPHTEFRRNGDKAFTTMHPIMDALSSSYPGFFQTLGYRVFTKDLIEFYSNIVRQNVLRRQKDKIRRNDFLDILMELKNNKADSNDLCLQMDDVIAQSFLVFIGGFETSSSAMSFALYELALYPAIQEKARSHIREVLETHQGVFSYESLNKMIYIKQVIQETLRKHPVGPIARRVCRTPFTLTGTRGESLTIQPGVQILIPIYAIHHDPDYYADPEQFQPERFSATAKDEIKPMAYLPFGAGPRTCIAERLGLMQTTMGVALLLNSFKFSICSSTPKELIFDPLNSRVFSVIGGIPLRVERLIN